MRKIFFLMFLCSVLLAVLMAWYLMSNLPLTANVDVQIPRNTSINAASEQIGKQRMVRYPALFSFALRAYCVLVSKGIYAGTYRFNGSHTHLQLVHSLVTGKQALKVRITFPEGITSYHFASLLRAHAGVDSARFMKLVFSDSMRAALGISAPSLEGYLMPNTYEYFWKQPADDVIEQLVAEQNKLWRERFEQQAIAQAKTRLEILTLASIVEAETPQSDERARVAGVYTNRLKKGMKLEADPTVQYALGGEARRLYLSDLQVRSSYNTYLHEGLPPGPINSPSSSSIEAALFPEVNSYYFFCAKGDGSNSHSFAASSEGHHINVMRYRRNRARD